MPEKHIGKVVQVMGPVLDIRFRDGELPALLNAVELENNGKKLIVEVAQHIGDNVVRCIAMAATDGLVRGTDAVDTGEPIKVPVGDECLGRVFNLLGEPVDEQPAPENIERWPIHRPAPAFDEQESATEILETGIKVVDLICPYAKGGKIGLLELPRVMFGALEQDTARRIAATQDAGFAGYEVSNIAHLRLCRGLPMTGGFGLNITNNVAAQFYAEQGLSSLLILPEVKDSDIASIAPTRNGKPVPTGVMIYGHMPLMLTRACPLQNIHDCAHCDKTGVLTDRKAKKFPVRCGLGVRTIYNPVPIYMGDKPGALAVDYGVAYFTLESREEAAQILDSIRTHAPFEGDFTRGLYFKGTN